MITPWKAYQQEAASFFRSLGLEASTDVTVKGVRTDHDVDVLVSSSHVGFQVTWIVECKNWKRPISKVHVLALREIVSDVGADRGILLSEAGFQSGAVEAANLTNVQVTSLAELEESARNEVFAMRLRDLFDRIEICHIRYWEIPKGLRIKYGLRPGAPQIGYSGAMIVDASRDLVSRAIRGRYPFRSEAFAVIVCAELDKEFTSPKQVIAAVEPLVVDLERKLDQFDARNAT